jgi:predicted transcriptional regulator
MKASGKPAVARTLEEIIAALPASRRRAVETRAAELIEQELSLKELRRSLRLTQTEVARRLRKGQDAVSRIETRDDLLLSTLRDYVAALDGRLEMICHFKDRRAVRIVAVRPQARQSVQTRAKRRLARATPA